MVTPARLRTPGRRARHAKPSVLARNGAPLAVCTALGAGVLALGTGTASAQTADDFARLRQCESGGNYSINTGNGYYGAYQFSPGTWRSLGYGGLPHQASPATQDEAARALQARSGWGQWPACSRKLGLRNGASAPAPAPAPPTPVPVPDVPRASRGGDVVIAAPEVAPKESVPAPSPVVPQAQVPTSADVRPAVEPPSVVLPPTGPTAVGPPAAVRRSIASPPAGRPRVAAPAAGAPAGGAAAAPAAEATAAPVAEPTVALGAGPRTAAAAPGPTVVAERRTSFEPQVKAWQARMVQRGWTLDVDGYFGPQSAAVARRFAIEKAMPAAPVGTLSQSVLDGAWSMPVTGRFAVPVRSGR